MHRQRFKTTEDMDAHLVKYHYNLYCGPCDRSFVNMTSLRLHLKNHERTDRYLLQKQQEHRDEGPDNNTESINKNSNIK